MDGGRTVISAENLKYEIGGRLHDLDADLGKVHLSVRWEPGPQIARVGVSVERYAWDNRLAIIAALVDFESAHADELALEFDVIPLEAVTNEHFAEA